VEKQRAREILQQLQTTAARPGSVGAGDIAPFEMRIFPIARTPIRVEITYYQELDTTTTACLSSPTVTRKARGLPHDRQARHRLDVKSAVPDC